MVGICRGRICEALGYNTITDSIVVKLYVTINNYSFSANFCIIVNTSNYFDLLIGMKTIADNYLFIHPISKSLCRFYSLASFDVITLLLENQNLEYISCFIKFIGKGSINSLNFNEETNTLNKMNNAVTSAPQTENLQSYEDVPQNITPPVENLSPMEYIHS